MRGTTLRRWAPASAWGIWLIGALLLAAVLLLGAAPGSTALGELNLFVVVRIVAPHRRPHGTLRRRVAAAEILPGSMQVAC